MKKNLLIILALMFCSYSCQIFFEHTYFIRVYNNSSDTILVYPRYNYPDTTLNLKKPGMVMVYPNTQNRGIESKTDWKDKLQSDTLSIFIISKDTFDAYNWEDIRSEYNILKRYDLSLEDLNRMNWAITYP